MCSFSDSLSSSIVFFSSGSQYSPARELTFQFTGANDFALRPGGAPPIAANYKRMSELLEQDGAAVAVLTVPMANKVYIFAPQYSVTLPYYPRGLSYEPALDSVTLLGA